MNPPAVSVLLPVRDAEATLPTCLRSLLRQSEHDWECILVDDGSRDETPKIAEAFAKGDARFRILRRPPEGIVSSLNAGLAECRGPRVARMDADDWMHRERLRLQREALDTDDDLAAVGSHVRLFPRANLAEGMRAYEAWLGSVRVAEDVARDRYVECPLAHPTWMVRRSAFHTLPYRDRGWPEDQDWILRAGRRGWKLGVVPRRLVSWRRGPGQLSARDPRYGIDRFVACKAHHLARDFLREVDTYVLWGYGATGRALRTALLAEGRAPTHIVELHPGRLGQRIHGAPVIDPEALTGVEGRVVVSVAGAGPRGRIRAALAATGRQDGVDFICAA